VDELEVMVQGWVEPAATVTQASVAESKVKFSIVLQQVSLSVNAAPFVEPSGQ
jgi:hypothetical protein